MYKKGEALFWTAEEMDLSNDIQDWNVWLNSMHHFAKGTVDVQEN
jgi:ribonucleotide reductase beta subunit family protein with ferritin-like domain